MKRKLYIGLLLLEAVLCLVLVFALDLSASPAIFAFPFAPLGLCLRMLSLSGSAGNLAAWVLYGILCLSPFLFFLHRRKRTPEDLLIPLISAVLFAVMYFMINPTLLGNPLAAADPLSYTWLVSPVWGLLLAYGLLRLRRWLAAAEISSLLTCLSLFLALVGVVFIAMIFGAGPSSMLDELQSLQTGNTALSAQELLPSRFFVLLRGLVQLLPYVLDLLILFFAFSLLDALRADPYAQTTLAAAQRLGHVCGWSLAAAALANSAVQLLQLCFAGHLYSIHAVTEIPLLSLAFMTAVLLLARLIEKSRALKEENDSFI